MKVMTEKLGLFSYILIQQLDLLSVPSLRGLENISILYIKYIVTEPPISGVPTYAIRLLFAIFYQEDRTACLWDYQT